MHSASRIQLLDILRGFALSGIVVINGMSIFAVKGSTPAFTVKIPIVDRLLQDLILFFVESKFFTLFSLLFGIGFAIQIASAERQGTKFLPRISRRLTALLLFGFLHIMLLWDGDILVIYAVTGAILVLLRNISARAARRWILGLLGVPALLVLGALAYSLLARLTASGAASLSKTDAGIVSEFGKVSAAPSNFSTDYLASIADRIHSYIELSPLLLSRIPTVLAMFLIGLHLGKSGFFRNPQVHTATLVRARNLGLSVGFTLMILVVSATKLLPAFSALLALIEDQYLAGPILCLGIASAVTLSYLKNPNRAHFRHFASVGQMALTNYLAQSLVLVALSQGWGFGLATKLSGFQVLGVVTLLFAVQVMASAVWLRHFSYGPCEWAWRCITYWRRVPLRRESAG